MNAKLIAGVVTLMFVAAACGSSTTSDLDSTWVNDETVRSPRETRTTSAGARSSVAPNELATPDTIAAQTRGSEFGYTGEVTDDEDGRSVSRRETDPVEDSLSTFALDVDTGSYTIGKHSLQDGRLPTPDTVRTEEYVNALNYHYPQPADDEDFAIHLMGGVTPFSNGADTYLLQVGLQAFDVSESDRPAANLTFVIDVSGSMSQDDKLDTVKEALLVLVDNLQPDDQVAIVAYDDLAYVIVEPTSDPDVLVRAIERLQPGGSTNAEAGLVAGYELAEAAYDRNAINRVILASDGVANVGETDPNGILAAISEAAGDGINLVTVGVGMGDYNDYLLEQLADNGDGFYAYVNTFDEIRDLFARGITGTLYTVAKDARVQVEFNPDTVLSYRLLGYENREIADEDFRNDSVDAGEIGAGHSVTAIYELVLTEQARSRQDIATVNLRWLNPRTNRPIEMSETIQVGDLYDRFDDSPKAFRAATTVAAYAEVLRESRFARHIGWDELVEVADKVARDVRDDDFDQFSDLVYEASRIQR